MSKTGNYIISYTVITVLLWWHVNNLVLHLLFCMQWYH